MISEGLRSPINNRDIIYKCLSSHYYTKHKHTHEHYQSITVQTDKSTQQLLGQWGILLTKPKIHLSDDLAETWATLFHITRNDESQPVNFEYTNARLKQ